MDKKSFKNKVGKTAKKEVDERSYIRLYSDIEKNKQIAKEMDKTGYIKTYNPLSQNYENGVVVLTSYLINYFFYMEKVNNLQDDGSFYCTHETISTHTPLSIDQIKKYKKRIIRSKWIQTKMKGNPPKEYYFLNLEKINEDMYKTELTIENNNKSSNSEKFTDSNSEKFTDSNSETELTIENNNKSSNSEKFTDSNKNPNNKSSISEKFTDSISEKFTDYRYNLDNINIDNIKKLKNIKKEKKKEKNQKNNLSPKKEKTIFIQNEIDIHPEKDNINSSYPENINSSYPENINSSYPENINSSYPENINLPTLEKEKDHMKKLDLIPLSEKEIKLLHDLKDKDPLVHVFRKYILPELKDNKQILYKVDKYIKHRQKVDKDQNNKKPTLTEYAMQLNALDINKYKRAIREYGPEFVLRVFEHTFKSPWKGIFPDKIEKEMDREKLYNQKSFIHKKSIVGKINTDFKDPDQNHAHDHER